MRVAVRAAMRYARAGFKTGIGRKDNAMEKTVAIMLGDGFEPVEAIGPADVLRRGGAVVDLVSVMGRAEVDAAHEVTVVADKLLDEVDLSSYDLLVVPGGSVGVDHLAACAPLADELRRRMAAILANLGLLEGREAVCYPGCEDVFPAGAYQAGSDVAVDGNLITATGPGIALVFGVALLNALAGAEATAQVARDMLLVK